MSKPRGSLTLKTKRLSPGVRHVRAEGPPDLEVEHRKLSDLRLDDDNIEELNMFSEDLRTTCFGVLQRFFTSFESHT